jgi:hypothetical protein
LAGVPLAQTIVLAQCPEAYDFGMFLLFPAGTFTPSPTSFMLQCRLHEDRDEE